MRTVLFFVSGAAIVCALATGCGSPPLSPACQKAYAAQKAWVARHRNDVQFTIPQVMQDTREQVALLKGMKAAGCPGNLKVTTLS